VQHKNFYLLVSLTFLTLLSLPVIQMIFNIFPEPIVNTEGRESFEFDFDIGEINLDSLSEFAQESDIWFRKNFGLRTNLIRWNSLIKWKVFGISALPEVIIGRNGWLFYCSEAVRDGNSIRDYQGFSPLNDEELEWLKNKLEKNNAEFQKNNIIYIVVIAPNKNTIYPEYLPDYIKKIYDSTMLDQLVCYLKNRSSVELIDLRDALFREKLHNMLYYMTDTHWNDFGAYICYREIMDHLSSHFPQLREKIVPVGSVGISSQRFEGDLAKLLVLQDLFHENNTSVLVQHEETKPQLDTLVFRHDSFGDKLYPFLKRHFKNIKGHSPFGPFDFDEIQSCHPQVVIHLMVERYVRMSVSDDYSMQINTTPKEVHPNKNYN
jgi:hypothetical protein